ncbi:MAG: 50S ribosome-binding GTPase [Deltaproteobacteria bacterium]|nr:50S ribosome-binding GTPase [Deltaproteobacteria bacterium]
MKRRTIIGTLLLSFFFIYPTLQANGKKTPVHLLFIGKTGAGKSTAINAIYNYIKGHSFKDDREIIIPMKGAPCNVDEYMGHSDENLEHSFQSATQDCFTYRVENDRYEVTIVDTPGFADSRGPEQDKINIEKIVAHLQKVPVQGIIITVSSGDTRLSADVGYYLSELKRLLTKDAVKHFVFLITHSSGDVEALEALDELDIPHNVDLNVFCFQNEGLLKYNPSGNKNQQRSYSNNWLNGLETTEDLLKYVSSLPLYQTEQVKRLSDDRRALEGFMEEQVDLVRQLQKEKATLDQLLLDIACATKQIDDNKDFSIKTPKEVEKKVPLANGKKNTVCRSCGKICHHNCQLNGIYEDAGNEKLIDCWAFNQYRNTDKHGVCGVCEHTLKAHAHSTFTVIMETIYETQIFQGKKDAKDKAEAEKSRLENLKLNSEKRIKNLEEQEIPDAYKKIACLYYRINELNLGFERDYFVEYVENLKKSEQESPRMGTKERQVYFEKLDQELKKYQIFRDEIEKARDKYPSCK